ncbi:MAG: AI-2E family transporter [Gemmataceae bacterium]|nr:AI-2E family transporter [Gemmataceae bacterium]
MTVNLTTATRLGLNLSIFLGVSLLLYLGRSIFVPLVLGVLLATVLHPLARFLHRAVYLPWFFACVGAIIVSLLLLLVVIVALVISVSRTIEGLPKSEEEWKQQYREVQQNMSLLFPYGVERWLPPDPDQSNVYRAARDFFTGSKISDVLAALLARTSEYIWYLILILFITLFLLIEGRMLTDKVRAIFGPSPDIQNRVTAAVREMAESIRTYLVWRTIINVALGLILGAIYNAANLKYWYLWALLVIVLSYVPYLGTIAAGIPPVLDALLFVNPLISLLILVIYTGIVTIEGYLIVPWIMGRSMDLNATTVILACLFWQELWGVAGLFLAMPIMAAIRATCMQVEGWERWGQLLSSGANQSLNPTTDKDATGTTLPANILTSTASVPTSSTRT